MKRLLFVFMLLAIGVYALGLYLAWFQFSTLEEGQKTNIKFTIDKDKIRKDEEKAMEKLQEAGQSIKEKTKSATEKAKDEGKEP